MRMRAVRSLVVACVCVVGCLVILSTLTNTTPASPTALHTLVTNTHNHLNHLHNNIKEEFESFVSAPDPEVLHKLGFIEEPVLYPHTNWTNLTTPVIATAVQSSEIDEVSSVVSLAAQVCASATLLVYTLDLSQKQLEQVESLCNDTCSVVPFDHSQFPSHVRNWRLRAYRPIIIQELLVRAGAVLWLDPSIRLVNPLLSGATNSSENGPPDDSEPPAFYDAYFGVRLQLPSRKYPKGRDAAYRTVMDGDHGRMSPSLAARLALRPSSTYSATSSPVFAPGLLEGIEDATENSSSLQPLYPADQVSLLNLENYVSVKERDDTHLVGGSTVEKEGINMKKKIIQNSVRWKRQPVNSHSIDYDLHYSEQNKDVSSGVRKRHTGVDDILGENTLVEEAAYPINEEDQHLKDLTKSSQMLNQSRQRAAILRDRSALFLDPSDGLISSPDSINDGTNKNNGHLAQTASELSSVNKETKDESAFGSGDSGAVLERGPHLNYAHVGHSDAAPQLPLSKANTLSVADIDSLLLLAQVDENSLLSRWGRLAQQHQGVLAWPLSNPVTGHLPTAALTHPGMFSAMHTPKHLYDFHQMSDPGAVLLYNTRSVHMKLMKPWLTCSLTHHCVQPIGAQDTGCRFDKKPLFRYSGCHLYDTSAFNVALGLMIGPNSHPFQPPTPPTFTRTPPSSPDVAAPVSTPFLVPHHYGHRTPEGVTVGARPRGHINGQTPSSSGIGDYHHSPSAVFSSSSNGNRNSQFGKVSQDRERGLSGTHVSPQQGNKALLFNSSSVSSNTYLPSIGFAKQPARPPQRSRSPGNAGQVNGIVSSNKTSFLQATELEAVTGVRSKSAAGIHTTRSRRSVTNSVRVGLSQQPRMNSRRTQDVIK